MSLKYIQDYCVSAQVRQLLLQTCPNAQQHHASVHPLCTLSSSALRVTWLNGLLKNR